LTFNFLFCIEGGHRDREFGLDLFRFFFRLVSSFLFWSSSCGDWSGSRRSSIRNFGDVQPFFKRCVEIRNFLLKKERYKMYNKATCYLESKAGNGINQSNYLF
jgi:hypothetical protein